MVNKFILSLFGFLFFFGHSYGQKKYPMPGQNKDFPLYTALSEKFVDNFHKAYNWGNFNKKAVLNYRNILKGKADSGDVRAQFLLAQCYDLFEFGIGEEKDVPVAMRYYLKAANQNYADGELFLYHLYKYGLMNLKTDSVKAIGFLRRAEAHGDNEILSKVYTEFATLHCKEPTPDSNGILQVPMNDSTIFYLKKALELNPKDTWSMDFLGGIYAERKEFDKAVFYMEKTDNIQNWIELAQWYIEGDKLKKDMPKALQLLYKACDEVISYGEGYMGSIDPVYFLNRLYYCEKLITKEQVSKYLKPHCICD